MSKASNISETSIAMNTGKRGGRQGQSKVAVSIQATHNEKDLTKTPTDDFGCNSKSVDTTVMSEDRGAPMSAED
jgi:hypothetical protein